MTESTPEKRAPGVIRDEIDAKVTALFEYNQKVVAILRDKAKDWESLAGFYESQKQRCYEIQELHIELVAVAAEMTGDILIAEFGIVHVQSDQEQDDDD